MGAPGAPVRGVESRLIVHMNKQEGNTHLTHAAWFDADADGERFNWLEVLLCEDRRSYVVQQLERAAELRSPAATPSTTVDTIGVRLISSFLQRTALARKPWTALNGQLDTSGE